MDTFSFPYHTVKTKYPESADKMQFGNSYEYVSKPRAPDQRIFTLNFLGMKYFFNSDGTVNPTANPTFNYRTFLNFYEAHGTWDVFTYPHPELGNITVRFNKAFEGPDPIPGGDGAVSPFTIELKEQP